MAFDLDAELFRQPAHISLTASDLESMGKRASQMFLHQDTPLSGAVVKVAQSCSGITSEQVKRVVEYANVATYQDLFQKQASSKDACIEFDAADPSEVLRQINKSAQAPIVKVASEYGMAPPQSPMKDLEADLVMCEMFGQDPDELLKQSSAARTLGEKMEASKGLFNNLQGERLSTSPMALLHQGSRALGGAAMGSGSSTPGDEDFKRRALAGAAGGLVGGNVLSRAGHAGARALGGDVIAQYAGRELGDVVGSLGGGALAGRLAKKAYAQPGEVKSSPEGKKGSLVLEHAGEKPSEHKKHASDFASIAGRGPNRPFDGTSKTAGLMNWLRGPQEKPSQVPQSPGWEPSPEEIQSMADQYQMDPGFLRDLADAEGETPESFEHNVAAYSDLQRDGGQYGGVEWDQDRWGHSNPIGEPKMASGPGDAPVSANEMREKEARFLKTAGMAFEDQDRPSKAKEVFAALKRDHPEYSAEKKARIAHSTHNKMANVMGGAMTGGGGAVQPSSPMNSGDGAGGMSFECGGVVPGKGPKPATVHGGEVIMNPEREGVSAGEIRKAVDDKKKESSIQKVARIFGRSAPGGDELAEAAVPWDRRVDSYRQYLTEKSQEEETPMRKALLGGGLAGLGGGALMGGMPGLLHGNLGGALSGGLAGGAVGGLGGMGLGALMQKSDAHSIEHAKGLMGGEPGRIEDEVQSQIASHRAMERMMEGIDDSIDRSRTEQRHQELLDKMEPGDTGPSEGDKMREWEQQKLNKQQCKNCGAPSDSSVCPYCDSPKTAAERIQKLAAFLSYSTKSPLQKKKEEKGKGKTPWKDIANSYASLV